MHNTSGSPYVKVYHGYGHARNLVVFGHVLAKKPPVVAKYSKGVLRNIKRLFRLFFVNPIPGANLRLHWEKEVYYTTAESDGFFKFEWEDKNSTPAGWHTVHIDCIDKQGEVLSTGEGQIFVPHVTQYAFISDIDDTVLVSFSATVLRRLRVLFTGNPHTRLAFPDAVQHYNLLAKAQTTDEIPNPFFYVSSSEWNLYDDLTAFFSHNHLPPGVFLLNSIKRWYEIAKTGKTKHEGKLLRIVRIMEAFPNQKFVLLGDNSQHDPSIYAAVAEKYRANVHGIYIRNVRPSKAAATKQVLQALEEKGIHTCLFINSSEAIQHSKKISLLE